MTAATAQLCGHRWDTRFWCGSRADRRHRCDRPTDHNHIGPCRCRCGATTTREDDR